MTAVADRDLISASAALGMAVFGHLPDGWALAGMGVIMLSGGYTLHRDYVRRRKIGVTR